MNERIDSFVIRRKYKRNFIYSYGDLVEYDGDSYIALTDGKLPTPSKAQKSWYRLNSRKSFYRSDSEPKFSEEGDKWFDPSSGLLYTRIKQTNGVMFWIEL